MPGPSRESGSLGGGFAPPPPKYAAIRNETAIHLKQMKGFALRCPHSLGYVRASTAAASLRSSMNSHFVPLRVSTEGVFQRTLRLWQYLFVLPQAKKSIRQNQPADIEKNQRGSSGILLPEPLFI